MTHAPFGCRHPPSLVDRFSNGSICEPMHSSVATTTSFGKTRQCSRLGIRGPHPRLKPDHGAFQKNSMYTRRHHHCPCECMETLGQRAAAEPLLLGMSQLLEKDNEIQVWFGSEGKRDRTLKRVADPDIGTVSLVSRDPASRDLRNTLLMKDSTYSNIRHIIVTALPQSVH